MVLRVVPDGRRRTVGRRRARDIGHQRPSAGPGQRTATRWRWPLVAFTWCGLIAGTSSTVILPHDLFAWVASRVLKDEASFRAFVIFWGYNWFAIVKGWHAAEFAILFALALACLDRLAGPRPRRNITAASVLCLLFAISDEYHQTFVPGRGGTWADVAIDGSGIAVAGLIAWLRRGRRGLGTVSLSAGSARAR